VQRQSFPVEMLVNRPDILRSSSRDLCQLTDKNAKFLLVWENAVQTGVSPVFPEAFLDDFTILRKKSNLH